MFIADFWGCPVEKLTLRTRLLEDLGLDGDDASEFLAAYAERFHVDLTGMQFDRHFGSEGASPLELVTALLYWLGLWRIDHVPITIGDLVQSANRGAWIEVGTSPQVG